jgi:hypothetical protein
MIQRFIKRDVLQLNTIQDNLLQGTGSQEIVTKAL